MKVFSTAILFLSLFSGEALAQNTTFPQTGGLAYEHLNYSAAGASFLLGVAAYHEPVVVDAPTSQITASLMGHFGPSTTPPRLLPYFPSYTTPAFQASLPFTYRCFDGGTRSSGEILEAFQIASSIGLPGFDGPALNRVQNMVVHVMRHYDWHEAVRVNRDCVRSLSCSSLYEKSLVQRMALRPPNWFVDSPH